MLELFLLAKVDLRQTSIRDLQIILFKECLFHLDFVGQFQLLSNDFVQFYIPKSTKLTKKENMLNMIKKTMAQSTPTQLQSQIDFDQSDIYLHYLKDGTYLIDHKALPYIFRFNYAALQKLRLSRSSHVPKIAHDIFYYVKDKLIVGRYSQGGRFPNRMKYEQKVKFVMRAFDHTHSQLTKKQCPRNQHYNRQSQIQFFSRAEVRENFIEEIQRALKKKKAENQRKILHFERYIETAIQLGHSQPEVAEKIFKEKIQRKQLPWTDNMFMDISDFSRILYARYTNLNPEEQKKILQMQQFQAGEWQVSKNLKQKREDSSSLKDEQDFRFGDQFQMQMAD